MSDNEYNSDSETESVAENPVEYDQEEDDAGADDPTTEFDQEDGDDAESMDSNEDEMDNNDEDGEDYQQDFLDDNQEDNDSEYEEDDVMYEKFDEGVRKKYIESVHPELIYRTNEEIEKLCIVTRDETTGKIIDDHHKTLPILSKFEFTRVIGSRISQLAQGAKAYVDNEKVFDHYITAEAELKQRRLPYIIMRPLPNGQCEYWKLQDLEIIH